MRQLRIYTEQVLECNSEVALESGPAHHLSTVLRVQIGREVILFNGQGGEYVAKVSAVSKRDVRLRVESFRNDERESNLHTELGIGLSKGDRFEWVLQKATELGVTAIAPLFTERSEVKLQGDREAKKLAHWQQIIVSACEQSGRTRVPKIQPPQSMQDWIKNSSAERKWILHPDIASSELASSQRPKSVALLIGPEGGFSELEVAQALAAQFQGLQLGPRVLRTETAPIAALSLLQWQWGDLQS